MKTIGNKSMSASIAMILNLLLWIEWAVGIGFIILLGITGYYRGGYALQLPITFSEITIRNIHSLTTTFPGAIINTEGGLLSLHIKANSPNLLLIILGYGLIFAAVVIITYQLKVIFSNFKKDLPFNELNVKKIRNIAFVLIMYSVMQCLFVFAVNLILSSNLNWGGMQLTYNFNINYALMGIILVIVAEVFKIGHSLEEEKKLTI